MYLNISKVVHRILILIDDFKLNKFENFKLYECCLYKPVEMTF